MLFSRTSRPRLEQLENRLVPALWPASLAVQAGAIVPAGQVGLSSPGNGMVEKGATLSALPSQVDVTVAMNAGPSVYDLSKVLTGWEGWKYHDPPRLMIAGNSNRALVTPSLTDTELKLAFATGQSGTTRVTVSLMDAAGASIGVTFVITVQPPLLVVGGKMPSLKLPSGASPLAD